MPRHAMAFLTFVATLGGCSTERILEPAALFAVGPQDSFIQEGMLLQLTPILAPGTPPPSGSAEWSSSKPEVASVNSAGLVTALSAGISVIGVKLGGATDSAVVRVRAAEGATLVAFGRTTCGATTTAGEVCWGENRYGQTGTRLAAEVVFIPTPVPAAVQWRSISGSWNHACGVDTLFDIYCWGLNHVGQLGMGIFSDPVLPSRKVETQQQFAAVSAGGAELQTSIDEELYKAQLTCGLTREGDAYCWGFSGSPLRAGDSPSSIPKRAAAGIQFATISVGNGYVCGVSRDRRGYCWGNNDFGQLGRATSAFDRTAREVDGGLRFESISAGGLHACGVTTAGDAYCWGANGTMQLGASTTTTCMFRGTPRPCSQSPVAVAGNFKFKSVAASSWGSITAMSAFAPAFRGHTCGLTVEQSIVCWGNNEAGRIRRRQDLFEPFELPPTQLAFGEQFRAVAVGESHTCGLVVSGQVWCWGDRTRGQRGIPPSDPGFDFGAVAGTYVFK